MPFIGMKLTSVVSFISQHALAVWALFAFALLVFCAPTINLSPTQWQDEMQIIEHGRLFSNPNSDWSINWNIAAGRPNLSNTSWLSNFIQFSAFTAFGQEVSGSRLVSMLGMLCASLALLFWVNARGLKIFYALCISLLFLLEPSITQSYRGGRVDVWCFAFIFAGCLMLAKARISCADSHKKALIGSFASGFILAHANFVWPSVVLLYPLVLLELLPLLSAIFKRKCIKGVFFCFLGGGTLATAILIIPIYPLLVRFIEGTGDNASSVMRMPNDLNDLLMSVKGLLLGLKLSIPTLALSVYALFRYRLIKLLPLTLITLCVILASIPYMGRAIYLLPYIFIMIAEAAIQSENRTGITHKVIKFGLVASLILAAAISLFARNAKAMMEVPQRDASTMRQALTSLNIPEDSRVLTNTYNFYPFAVQSKWMLYNATSLPPEYTDFEPYEIEFLESLDYAVLENANPRSSRLGKALTELGLKKMTVILTEENTDVDNYKYGPYTIYKKANSLLN